MTNPENEGGKIQDKGRTYCSSRNQRKVLKRAVKGGISVGSRNSPERVPDGQSRNYRSTKINNIVSDYDPKYKINIHEYILL